MKLMILLKSKIKSKNYTFINTKNSLLHVGLEDNIKFIAKTENSINGNENCGIVADQIVSSANFLASRTSSNNLAGSV